MPTASKLSPPCVFGSRSVTLPPLLPDLPRNLEWFVVQIKDDGRMVLIERRQVLPERDAVLIGQFVLTDLLAPFARIGPVQVEDHIDAVRRAQLDNLLDEGAVRLPPSFCSLVLPNQRSCASGRRM